MQEALEQLESGARERMLDAFMPKSKGNVRSAAKKFAFFMHTYPTLGLFRRATPFDPDATAHNEWILILFAHWLCSVPSRKTGRPLKGASIASYVSTVKGLMSHVYKFDITHDPQRLRRVVKDIRDKDPLAMRKKRRRICTGGKSYWCTRTMTKPGKRAPFWRRTFSRSPGVKMDVKASTTFS